MAVSWYQYSEASLLEDFIFSKEVISFNKITELKQLILSTVSTDNEILKKMMVYYTKYISNHCPHNKIYISNLITLFMIIHHTTVLVKDKINSFISVHCEREAYYNYLSFYFKGVPPSDCFRTLRKVWERHKDIDLILELLYCNSLLQHKHYKLFTELISDNMECFLEHYDLLLLNGFMSKPIPENTYKIYVTVLLHLLSHSVKQKNTTNIKRTVTAINNVLGYSVMYAPMPYQGLIKIEYLLPPSMFIIDVHHLSLPNILNHPFKFSKRAKFLQHNLYLAHCKKMMNQNNYIKHKSLLREHCLFISSMAGILSDVRVPCKMRHQYSQILMFLLHICASSTDTQNTELVLYGIQKLCSTLFTASNSDSCRNCYCYGGKYMCAYQQQHKRSYYDILPLEPRTSSEILQDNFLSIMRKYEINDKNPIAKFFKEITDIMEKKPEFNWTGESFVHKVPTGLNIRSKEFVSNKNQTVTYKWPKECVIHSLHRVIEYILNTRTADMHKYEPELHEIIKVICHTEMKPEIQEIMFHGLTPFLEMTYYYSKDHEKLATSILDMHMTEKGNVFLSMLTKYTGEKLLHLNNDITDNENRILYQLFCIVRSARRKSEHHAMTIEKYIKYFTFIPKFDKDEEISKLSKLAEVVLMLLLLLSTLSSGGHHKSAKLKKYLSLKYAYDDAILYLLWCSGDVEINPGPTIKKMKPLRASEKERKWIQEMCSTLVKIAKGIPVDSKPKSLWKDKPDNWPQDQPFYDPNNKSTVCNDDDQSDERLLICLIEFCNKKGIRIPDNFQREITTWKQGNEMLLFELYVNRKKIAEIVKALQNSKSYFDTLEFKRSSLAINIVIDIKVTELLSVSTPGITHAEIIRDLALTFCRIAKGLNPLEKSDGIWKKSPNGWKPENPFYSPHNAGKRREKGKDSSLVDNLLKYCEENNIAIRPKYKALADTWKLGNKEDLHKSYTVWSSIVQIEHSLKYLQLEGLLQKPAVLKELKTTGLTLDAQAWNLNLDTKATPAKPGFKNKSTNLQNLKLTTHKIQPICEKDQHQQKQNGGKILSQNHLEDQLSPHCSDNHVNHCISLPSTSGTTTKTSNNNLTLKKPNNLVKDSDFQCHPSEKSSEKEKKLNKNVSTDNPDIQHNTSTDCSSERDGNHTYPPINTKDLENRSTSLPDSTKNNLQTDGSLKVNKKRKFKCNTRSHVKRRVLSFTPVHLPESNANHPTPEEIHHCTDTKQQTTPNLDQYDGIIVSLVDQLSNLTENDSINNHGLRPEDLNHSTIQQTDANLNQITSVIDSAMDLVSPDCIVESDEEDSDFMEDKINDQREKLPEEILTSYINDFINCNNPEEKLHKDMDL